MAGNGVELVWEGKRTQIERVSLPFQRIEIINESRASRQSSPLFATGQLIPDPLFASLGEEDGWRNKLIWGDNKYVLASLLEGDASIGLEPLAGKVDLIYIDPPFATGADFSFETQIGDESITKLSSAVEEVAYRDTWRSGISSYLQMLHDRLALLRLLLNRNGIIYVHIGPNVAAQVQTLCDELFNGARASGKIVWKRTTTHSDSHWWGAVHDEILYYAFGTFTHNLEHRAYSDEYVTSHYASVDTDSGRNFQPDNLTAAGTRKGSSGMAWRGFDPNTKRVHWKYRVERLDELDVEGRIYWPQGGGWPRLKRYLDEMPGQVVGNLWDDIPPINSQAKESAGYDTQKPEALLNRVINASSRPGALVLDCFAGSGTTLASAEKLGRRWIGCDLGRFAIHTSRKRLLGIEGCKPFEVLNLGRYERKYWQGINAGEAVYEYLKFIVELYHAESISGFTHLHGRKDGAMVHVGATDAPVTIAEVRAAMEECAANGLKALDVLGWEWEMGLNSTGLGELQRASGVETRLFHIPHEIMDKRAVAAGDVHFYEAAYVKAELNVEKGEVSVRLADFLVAVDDYVREKVGDKVKKFSDWIDYWAVDFEYNGDVFHNQWQAYRTRKEPKLDLVSAPHLYAESGKRNMLVKVVDIFGNDTTALLEVTV